LAAAGTAVAATLLSHTGETDIVTREQLAALPAVIGTDTFKPIPHIELVQTMEKVLQRRGVDIVKEQYALRRDGSRLFGTFDLNYPGVAGTRAALGFRTANDKTMSIQIVAGLRVMVCDNLALRGDFIALKRRHTSGLVIMDEIVLAMDRYEQHARTLRTDVETLQNSALTDTEAKALLHDVFMQEAMAWRFFKNVSNEYFNPRHEEFAPRTKWSLHNAFTEVAKELPLNTRIEATQEVGRIFGLMN
jgi:hypothetical protein